MRSMPQRLKSMPSRNKVLPLDPGLILEYGREGNHTNARALIVVVVIVTAIVVIMTKFYGDGHYSS